MKLIRNIQEMQRFSEDLRSKGKTIALVPTLGALHEGHLSLLRRARKKANILVMSLFVNPIQFSDPADFKNYPRTLKADLKRARDHRVDVVFCPGMSQMYPKDYSSYVVEESLSKGLCGKSRPGHFLGVTTVVAKLFNIVKPHVAFFGQKDVQQALVIQRMVRDLAWDIQIQVAPTVREADGLAYSSRNARLTSSQREDALSLNEALFIAKVMIAGGERNARKVVQKMSKMIRSRAGARVDYIEIMDGQTLERLKVLKGDILVALAVRFGKVRLIDNLVINV